MKLFEEDIAKITTLLGDVQVLQKLGASALGSIYQIGHPKYGNCALKIFDGRGKKNKNFLHRFLHTAAAGKNILHRNFANIHQIGEYQYFFIIREFVAGQTLQQTIVEKKQLALASACEIILQVISALEVITNQGLTFKNLKPTNIILSSNNTVKLVDFSLPPTTPHYLSPEQCQGKKSTFASDIYSLGVVFYYGLCGEMPFNGQNAKEIMQAHLQKECADIRQFRQDIPPGIWQLLTKMLAKNPQHRYDNYLKIRSLLEAVGSITRQDEITLEFSDILDEDNQPEVVNLEPLSVHDTERILKRLEDVVDLASEDTNIPDHTVSSSGPLPKEMEEKLEEATNLNPFLQGDRAIAKRHIRCPRVYQYQVIDYLQKKFHRECWLLKELQQEGHIEIAIDFEQALVLHYLYQFEAKVQAELDELKRHRSYQQKLKDTSKEKVEKGKELRKGKRNLYDCIETIIEVSREISLPSPTQEKQRSLESMAGNLAKAIARPGDDMSPLIEDKPSEDSTDIKEKISPALTDELSTLVENAVENQIGQEVAQLQRQRPRDKVTTLVDNEYSDRIQQWMNDQPPTDAEQKTAAEDTTGQQENKGARDDEIGGQTAIINGQSIRQIQSSMQKQQVATSKDGTTLIDETLDNPIIDNFPPISGRLSDQATLVDEQNAEEIRQTLQNLQSLSPSGNENNEATLLDENINDLGIHPSAMPHSNFMDSQATLTDEESAMQIEQSMQHLQHSPPVGSESNEATLLDESIDDLGIHPSAMPTDGFMDDQATLVDNESAMQIEQSMQHLQHSPPVGNENDEATLLDESIGDLGIHHSAMPTDGFMDDQATLVDNENAMQIEQSMQHLQNLRTDENTLVDENLANLDQPDRQTSQSVFDQEATLVGEQNAQLIAESIQNTQTSNQLQTAHSSHTAPTNDEEDISEQIQNALAGLDTDAVPRQDQEQKFAKESEPAAAMPANLDIAIDFSNRYQTLGWLKFVQENDLKKDVHFTPVTSKCVAPNHKIFRLNLEWLLDYGKQQDNISAIKDFFQSDYDISDLGKGGMGLVLKLTTKYDGTILSLRPENCWARKYFADELQVRRGQDGKEIVYAELPAGKEFVVKVAFKSCEESLIQEGKILDLLAQEQRITPSIIGLVQQGRLMVRDQSSDSHLGYYVMMEYANQGNAESLYKMFPQEKLAVPVAFTMLYGMTQALITLKQKGIIHRDIKPQNILIDASGRPKLTDFGLSIITELVNATLNEERRRLLRLLDSEFLQISHEREQAEKLLKKLKRKKDKLCEQGKNDQLQDTDRQIDEIQQKIPRLRKQEEKRAEALQDRYRPISAEENALKGQFAGSLFYAAPEQFESEKVLTPQCDVYQLGAVMFTMFTGQRPVQGSNLTELLGKILYCRKPTICEMLPAEASTSLVCSISNLIAQMMDNDSESRIIIEEIQTTLDQILCEYIDDLTTPPCYEIPEHVTDAQEYEEFQRKIQFARKMHMQCLRVLRSYLQNLAPREQKILFICPQCEKKLHIYSHMVGKQGKCPQCRHPIIVKLPKVT